MLATVGAGEGSVLTAVITKQPLRPEWAAFAHGVYAHSIELDDTHSASSLHPGVVTIPAALATAELQGSSGVDLLTAIVAGYEVACRIGRALDPTRVYARGFVRPHRRPIRGRRGDGRALGLRPASSRTRSGSRRAQAAGRLEFFSTAPGRSAPPGLGQRTAATWRRGSRGRIHRPAAGLRGARRVLSGYGAADRVASLTSGLGAPFSCRRRASKPYACCRYNRADRPRDRARKRADLGPDDIARVRVGVVSQAIPIVVEPPARELAPTKRRRSAVRCRMRSDWGSRCARRRSTSTPSRALVAGGACGRGQGRRRGTARFDERFPAVWPAEVADRDRRTAACCASIPTTRRAIPRIASAMPRCAPSSARWPAVRCPRTSSVRRAGGREPRRSMASAPLIASSGRPGVR